MQPGLLAKWARSFLLPHERRVIPFWVVKDTKRYLGYEIYIWPFNFCFPGFLFSCDSIDASFEAVAVKPNL